MAIIMKRSDLEEEAPSEAEPDFAIACFSPLSTRPRRALDHFTEDGRGDAAPTNGDEQLGNAGTNLDPAYRNSVRRT
jgi:hypothetical protein